MYAWSRVTGRLIGQYVLCGLFTVFETTDRAWVARLIVVSGIVVFAFLQWLYFEALGLSWMAALLLALGTSVLPGMLVFGFWITAGSLISAYLASVVAALLTEAALRMKSGYAGMAALIASACAMQVVALLIYQTAAMYFWTLTAAMLATQLLKSARTPFRRLIAYALVGAAPMAGYFLWFKYSGLAAVLKAENPPRGTMFSDFATSFKWFFNVALPRAFSLWFFEFPSALGFVVMAIFIVSLIVVTAGMCWKTWRQGDRTGSLFWFAYPFVILALVLLAYCPMLVTSFRIEVFRSFIPLSALIFLTGAIHLGIILRAASWRPIFKLLAGASFAIGLALYTSNLLTSRMVLPAASEYSFVRTALLRALQSGPTVNRVHAIVPTPIRRFTTDEVYNLTVQFPQNIQPMIQISARELGLQVSGMTSSLQGEPFDGEGALILDFGEVTRMDVWKAMSRD
jgi:hypothetical protein